MFTNLLDHPLIQVELSTPFAEVGSRLNFRHVVYTGPVDAYYDYRFGALPYRSLRFEHRHLPETSQYQPVATVNEPGPEVPWTRITEFKHITGQQHPGTSIVTEYPQAQGDPYYPIPNAANEALYQRYKQLAAQESGVTFVGRLAQYRYYNMDQVVGAALAAAQRLKELFK
jgi:UDP-galactopyranose mutase